MIKDKGVDFYIKPELARDESVDILGARNVANMNGALLKYAGMWEYCKDLSGNHLGGSAVVANMAGLNYAEDVVDRNEKDLPWKAYASNYIEEDKMLVKSRRILRLDKICDFKNREILVFSSKVILERVNGEAVGVFGAAVDLTELKQNQLANFLGQAMMQEQHNQQILRQLDVDGKTVVLAQREAEVLYHLARGKSAKEVGKVLNLSNRTVESYVSNARNKTGCVNKAQLVDLYWQAVDFSE